MRPAPNPLVEPYRVRRGPQASDESYGNNGAFFFPRPRHLKRGINPIDRGASIIRVIVSDETHWTDEGLTGPPWEHVSVSLATRCPTWAEMAWIKSLFWSDDETVIQFHPPKSEYVNFHPFCLHLWRPLGVEIVLPPSLAVGPKGLEAA